MDPNIHPYYATLPTHRAMLVQRYTAAYPGDQAAAQQPEYVRFDMPEPAALDDVAVLLAEEVSRGD